MSIGRKTWSSDKLMLHLKNNKSDRTYWENIAELRRRGSAELFEECKNLAKSDIEKERVIAIDILAQLNDSELRRLYSEEVFGLFMDMIRSKKSAQVLSSILFGIGHNNSFLTKAKDIKLIASFRNHQSKKVREGTVFALLGIDNNIAVSALIDLSKDRYACIRNWATFGIGSMIALDNTSIREALFERIGDKNQDVRYEAIAGLAMKKDSRVIEAIEMELATDNYGSLIFEAIEELGDVRFLPALEKALVENKNEEGTHSEWAKALIRCIGKLKSL